MFYLENVINLRLGFLRSEIFVVLLNICVYEWLGSISFNLGIFLDYLWFIIEGGCECILCIFEFIL